MSAWQWSEQYKDSYMVTYDGEGKASNEVSKQTLTGARQPDLPLGQTCEASIRRMVRRRRGPLADPVQMAELILGPRVQRQKLQPLFSSQALRSPSLVPVSPLASLSFHRIITNNYEAGKGRRVQELGEPLETTSHWTAVSSMVSTCLVSAHTC
jgi:hypothetical protein